MKNENSKIIAAKDAKELAKVLGLPESDAIEWEFRSSLNDKIILLADRSKLTHAEIAKKVGTARTRITALLNRSRTDFSTDFMIRVLSALGYKINIKLSKIA
ncbi:MAG: XRE family transcriptional regulator [Leptospirales bacterium]